MSGRGQRLFLVSPRRVDFHSRTRLTMAVDSSSPTSQSKPSSPPPPYTEIADPALYAQPSTSVPVGGPNAPASSPFPTRTAYGPTPIQQQTQLLPYYDPRSPYAIAEANSRARWRFLVAFVWAVALVALMSLLTGYEVTLQTGGHIRHGGWMSGSDWAQW